MSKIALNGATVNDSIIQNHIYYRVWQYQGYNDSFGNPVYAYNYYYTSATVKGTAKSTVTNVKINGQSPIVQGDRTTENDTYTLPSGEYVSGAHTNTQGTVSVGNSKNVYANGKLIAVGGSSVNTHGGTTTAIGTAGLSTNVNIG